MNDTRKTTMYSLLMLTATIWGFQPLCIKWLVQEWTPTTITSIRYLAICLLLFIFIWKKYGYFLPPRNIIFPMLLMGITGIGLNNVLQFSGIRYTTVTNCTLISATTPAITALLAFFWIKERLSLFSWLGIILSFAGTIVVVSHGSFELIRSLDFNKGDVLCFLSQVVWAIYSILGLKVMKQLPALFVTAWAGLFGALITMIYGIFTNEFHITILTGLPLVSYLYTVLLGGVLSMVCWNLGVKNAGPSIASVFLNIMPIMGMFAGWFFFQEEVGVIQITGAMTTFAGVYLTTHSHDISRYLHKI